MTSPPALNCGAAQDVAAADDDGELHAALHDALGLAGDVQRLVDADAALAGVAEALAAELEDDALVFRFEGIAAAVIVHGVHPGGRGFTDLSAIIAGVAQEPRSRARRKRVSRSRHVGSGFARRNRFLRRAPGRVSFSDSF